MQSFTPHVRVILFASFLLARLAGPLTAAEIPVPASRPNFVIINIDDLGYAEIGPFGSANRTPHLDRMAAEGRKLTSHYGAPVCSPSRAALMTGCYPKRALPIPLVLFPVSAIGLHPVVPLIARDSSPTKVSSGAIEFFPSGGDRGAESLREFGAAVEQRVRTLALDLGAQGRHPPDLPTRSSLGVLP